PLVLLLALILAVTVVRNPSQATPATPTEPPAAAGPRWPRERIHRWVGVSLLISVFAAAAWYATSENRVRFDYSPMAAVLALTVPLVLCLMARRWPFMTAFFSC